MLVVENAESLEFLTENKKQTGVVYIMKCEPGYTPSDPEGSTRTGEQDLYGRMKCNNTNHWSNMPVCNGMTKKKYFSLSLLKSSSTISFSFRKCI